MNEEIEVKKRKKKNWKGKGYKKHEMNKKRIVEMNEEIEVKKRKKKNQKGKGYKKTRDE